MPSIFELLRQSFRLYREHGAMLAGYFAWLLLPYAGLLFLDATSSSAVQLAFGIVFVAIEIVLAFRIAVFATLAADAALSGRPTEHEGLKAAARARYIPFILTALLQAVVVTAGFILFVIPGILFSIWFAFSQIAAILEGTSGKEALAFSRSLVQGRFWKAFWYVLAGPFVLLLAYSLVMAPFVLLAGNAAAENPPIWLAVLDGAIELLVLAPITLVYSLLVYRLFRAPRPA